MRPRVRVESSGCDGPCIPTSVWRHPGGQALVCASKAGGVMAHAPLRVSGDNPANIFRLLRFENKGYGGPCVPTLEWGHPGGQRYALARSKHGVWCPMRTYA